MLVSVFNEDAILLAHSVPTRASHSGQLCLGPMNGLWLCPHAFRFHNWHMSLTACTRGMHPIGLARPGGLPLKMQLFLFNWLGLSCCLLLLRVML